MAGHLMIHQLSVGWNLFLAAIPVPLGYALSACAGSLTVKQRRVPGFAWLPLALVWMAFLPNTCYLLTEWRHFLLDPSFRPLLDEAQLDRRGLLEVAAWGLAFVAYSGSGALLFALAIRPVERLLRLARVDPMRWAPLFFFLVSLGVYLGLVLRLNSWDLATRPALVWAAGLAALKDPLLLAAIVVFAAILWGLYEAVDLWVDGVVERLSNPTGGRTEVTRD